MEHDNTGADVELSRNEQSLMTLSTLSFQVADIALRLVLLQRNKEMTPKDLERVANARNRLDEILASQEREAA